ncbi:hypothetical protein BpHYR1_019886 [Brachionus plicatilis]|uniref:Uncharacterized protein n=1 Tax=Brachionus plicatilis TaxID=10195 RepID=A0A3M7T9A9_BRAPC|nr:hypothetical protein BpHYR1_019886 [Brachionus plicatilis]
MNIYFKEKVFLFFKQLISKKENNCLTLKESKRKTKSEANFLSNSKQARIEKKIYARMKSRSMKEYN